MKPSSSNAQPHLIQECIFCEDITLYRFKGYVIDSGNELHQCMVCNTRIEIDTSKDKSRSDWSEVTNGNPSEIQNIVLRKIRA